MSKPRTATKEQANSAPATRKQCLCGCGGYPKSENARYLPGHDQRHEGNLVRAARAGDLKAAQTLVDLKWKPEGWLEREQQEQAQKEQKTNEPQLELPFAA